MAKKPQPKSQYTPELVKFICDELAAGKSLRSICSAENMPAESTVRGWTTDYPEFNAQYVRAREAGCDAVAEEILAIADDGTNDFVETNDPENPGYRVNGEHIQRSRLRVDARKWYLSKLLPKKYGDKIDHTSSDGSMTPKAAIDVGKLSDSALAEILNAARPSDDADTDKN